METECIRYFKENPGFHRMLKGLREKYRSLGNFGGVIRLDNLTDLERDSLSGFFRKDYYNKRSASIKVEDIYNALGNTKFEGVNLEHILEGYFNEELISKKEERYLYNQKRELYFEKLINEFDNTFASKWLIFVLESRANGYRLISKAYDEDREGLRQVLSFVMDGLNNLPFKESETRRLALFSSSISKDPHFFDDGTLGGNLLVYGIIYLLDVDYPRNAEDRAEVLYDVGIIKDEVSNYTTLSGMIAYRNGKLHRGWEGFYQSNEPMNISLWNLSKVEKVVSSSRNVFVFENPTVFSQVLETLEKEKPSLICTYGQIKLASLVLMDKLIDNVDSIYYSGDFDPEGLQIADKLKKRYRDKLVLWRFGKEDYRAIKSNIKLGKQRLKKLDSIESSELRDIALYMKEEGYVGYQELLTKRYIEDIKR